MHMRLFYVEKQTNMLTCNTSSHPRPPEIGFLCVDLAIVERSL